jgi:hypothetical protein
VLAGFCRSAPVTLELARQIQQSGQEVSALVVIDSQIENTNPAMLWLRRLIQIEGAFWGWDATARLERFLTLKRLASRIVKWTMAEPDGPPSTRAEADPIGACYQKARRGYVPGHYSGRVVLLKPVGSAFDVRWRKVAPDLRLGDLPGTHMTCLTAHVPTVCSHLKGALSHAWPSAGTR